MARPLTRLACALPVWLLLGCSQGQTERCDEDSELLGTTCVAKCQADERRIEGVCTAPSQIRVNSVGYFSDGPKLAVFTGGPAENFQVRTVPGADVAFEGAPGELFTDEDSGLQVQWADFTDLKEAGRYEVVVDGQSTPSAPFSIASAPFNQPLQTVMLGLHGLRCGVDVDFEYAGDRFTHVACHLNDGYESPDSDTKLDSLGGWHDAGDYGKYTLNGAFSVGMLLLAWQHFPALDKLTTPDGTKTVNGLPPYLDEAKFELDWLLTMQREDGATYHKLTALNFESFLMPEADLSRRQMAEPSTAATASFAAVMAQAARVYADYDEGFAARALEAAQRAYGFLAQHPERIDSDVDGRFDTGAYRSGDADDRLWAATELWLATQDPAYEDPVLDGLAAIEAVADDWDWSQVENLALFSYALSDQEALASAAQERVRTLIIESAERLATTAESHGFQRGLGSTYYWGANGLVARSVINLGTAFQLTGEERFKLAALGQLNHLFGLNVFGRSVVTGLGHYPPAYPHHRPSGADGVGAPWPGLLVGGPNNQRGSETLTERAAFAWQDSQGDYYSNEVAINWNAALAYGLAWMFAP